MTLPETYDYAELGALAPEPDDGEPRPCTCRSLFCDWCGDEAYNPGRPPREDTP
ncbi:hypothetical protein [Brachybacterium sp.]|uniref:hypothetical protein n=1 Tax=Brachybacterium sp. TaxID=1891286 RepID=UPI002ED3676E